jgi:hypothetical protein
MRSTQHITAYLHKQYAEAVKAVESRDISGWFDLWHTHIDWDSRANRFPSTRALVARMAYELLGVAERHFASRQEPVQLFALIDHHDTGNSAVFAHTPNPNGTAYPCELLVEWGTQAPPILADVVDRTRYDIGIGKEDGKYFIRPRPTLPA